MSSPLQDGSIATNDVIEAVHINQLFPILADLEDGKAFFRPDQGSANAYQVDFSGTPSNKNQFSAYHQGMLVIFKAANTNTGASTLQVVGPSGNLTALPLTKSGSVALEADDIQAGQMVAAVCNDLGSGNFRFELLSVSVASGGGFSGDELVFTGSNGAIRMNTSDGSDTGSISLNGGGAAGTSARGGRVVAHGNEEPTRPGGVHLRPGNVAGSAVRVDDGSSVEQLRIDTSGVTFPQLGSGIVHLTSGLASVKSNADVYQMLFTGTRADGSVTISSNTTLTRDMNYDVLTVQTGVVLKTDGYIVRARKIVLQGSGRLDNSGVNGGAVNSWDLGPALASRSLGGSGVGAYGTALEGPTGNGNAGPNAGSLTRAAGGVGGSGGAGGAGPSGTSGGASGAAGAITNSYYCGSLCPESIERGDTIVLGGTGGGGGGAGTPDGTYPWSGGSSGGSGSGGGVMVILCDELDVSSASAGCIRARGGNAAFGTSTWSSLNAGGAGGSGGGGGGYIHGFFGKVTGTLSNALDCDGGAGSAGTNGHGTGVGGVGGGGGSGGNIDVYRADTSSWISVRGSSGASGSSPSGITGGAAGAAGTCKASL